MPNSGYFDVVFAQSGDVAAVPDAVQPDGSVSFEQGYGIDYELDPAIDPTARYIERTKMNQIFNYVTAALQQYQQNGIPPFITSAMNNGSPFSYAKYATVLNGGVAYMSMQDSNTDTPPSAKWYMLPQFPRIRLTGSTTYYVATTGNDSNPGTSGSPWLTIQHAVDYVANSIDFNGYNVTISVADGTYAGGVVTSASFMGGGTVNLQGNTTTPANCIISTTGNCISTRDNAVLNVAGFKLQSSGGNLISSVAGATITIGGKMQFGNAGGSPFAHVYMNAGGNVNIASDYEIVGNATFHWLVETGGVLNVPVGSATVTLTGTPAFSTSFASANSCGVLWCRNLTFAGSATGVRYGATLNGVVRTDTGNVNYLPGNSAGSTATGGQYN